MFVQEVLEREVRLSYWEKVKQVVFTLKLVSFQDFFYFLVLLLAIMWLQDQYAQKLFFVVFNASQMLAASSKMVYNVIASCRYSQNCL